MIRMYLYGGMLAALLIVVGLFGWRMHRSGWDAATAHYSAVVSACMAANDRDARTIGNLEAANREWADAAKANADKVNQAMAQVKAAQANDARALADAQAKLKRVVYASHPALVWGLTRVPTGVADQLRK